MPDDKQHQSSWVRYAGLGVELAAAVGGLSLLGYWLDRRYGTSPWGLLICFAIGLVGGMYNFIRAAYRAFRESAADEPKPGGGPPP